MIKFSILTSLTIFEKKLGLILRFLCKCCLFLYLLCNIFGFAFTSLFVKLHGTLFRHTNVVTLLDWNKEILTKLNME